MNRWSGLLWTVLCCAATAAEPSRRNFVACPLLRDTNTVPCWLAEYDGELYYLGVQTDNNDIARAPMLGHRLLVEGTVTQARRICGGVVLDPVRTSVLPELDANCNTMLPAEDRYIVPFAQRGPGPSATADRRAAETAGTVADALVLRYDFDWPWVTGSNTVLLQQFVELARLAKVQRLAIKGFRGATLLSNGERLVERPEIGEQRARSIADLLAAVGFDAAKLSVTWTATADTDNMDGVDDWQSRQVVISVQP
jgi:hypothetical protein